MDQYVHHVPGRLRVRVSAIKGNSAQASSLERLVRAQQGVKDVQTNPLTGSVLVHYDPATVSVSTLSEMMVCSTANKDSRGLPAPAQSSSSKHIHQRIAARIVVAVVGHAMEMAVERAAAAFIAAIL